MFIEPDEKTLSQILLRAMMRAGMPGFSVVFETPRYGALYIDPSSATHTMHVRANGSVSYYSKDFCCYG